MHIQPYQGEFPRSYKTEAGRQACKYWPCYELRAPRSRRIAFGGERFPKGERGRPARINPSPHPLSTQVLKKFARFA
jgi:hypothetical protein